MRNRILHFDNRLQSSVDNLVVSFVSKLRPKLQGLDDWTLKGPNRLHRILSLPSLSCLGKTALSVKRHSSVIMLPENDAAKNGNGRAYKHARSQARVSLSKPRSTAPLAGTFA
jgi:hypothetical protein